MQTLTIVVDVLLGLKRGSGHVEGGAEAGGLAGLGGTGFVDERGGRHRDALAGRLEAELVGAVLNDADLRCDKATLGSGLSSEAYGNAGPAFPASSTLTLPESST